MSDMQADALIVITADVYRPIHGLLTSAEIVARRLMFDMSQKQLLILLA